MRRWPIKRGQPPSRVVFASILRAVVRFNRSAITPSRHRLGYSKSPPSTRRGREPGVASASGRPEGPPGTGPCKTPEIISRCCCCNRSCPVIPSDSDESVSKARARTDEPQRTHYSVFSYLRWPHWPAAPASHQPKNPRKPRRRWTKSRERPRFCRKRAGGRPMPL